MSRNKQIININSQNRCLSRIKTLCRDVGITQEELAEKLDISVQQVSRLSTGRSRLTYQRAKDIQSLYPQYSIEWLMGDSENKNIEEELDSVISNLSEENRLLLTGLQAFAKLSGYTIDPITEHSADPLIQLIHSLTSGYRISMGDNYIELSIIEMNIFQNEIYEEVKLRIEQLFRRENKNGIHS